MDSQTANFFSNYTGDVKMAVEAILRLQDRKQEAIDRGIVADLSNIDFSEYGDLAYLTEAKVLAASAAVDSLVTTLDAANRTGWAGLYGVMP